ncbi:MAG: polyphosphate kinase 2 family protein, partial [Anaerolineae bacterium]|nr:polyphosphate kinase 2 family protein [Anaerolineae bacterium]
MMDELRVKAGQAVRLAEWATDKDLGLTKDTAKAELDALQPEMAELQARLYAEGKRSLLVVLQGMDASGKDGTTKNVFGGVNPQGLHIVSFKAPTAHELAHDYLWRVHAACPPRGKIGVFNRSHYEDVLIVRVNGWIDAATCQRRYAQINDFERLLSENGTRVLKFMLHLSKDEQKKRLVDRLNSPDEYWKFSTGDLPVRARWGEYQQAYQDMLSACSTEHAPWYVIPADRKWARNLAVARVVLATLREMNPQYPPRDPSLDG